MVGGGEEHPGAVGEDHGLEDVDHLGDVSEADAFGVAMEGIEVNSGDKGVADGVLLIEESGVGPWFDGVPGTPFVDA